MEGVLRVVVSAGGAAARRQHHSDGIRCPSIGAAPNGCRDQGQPARRQISSAGLLRVCWMQVRAEAREQAMMDAMVPKNDAQHTTEWRRAHTCELDALFV